MKTNHFLKTILISSLILLVLVTSTLGQKKGKPTATTAKVPLTSAEIDQKVKDLLSKMTIEEKVGQMTQINLNVVLRGDYSNQDGTVDTALLKKAVVDYKVGSILNAINHAYSVELWHKIITQIQDASKRTPNQIPVLYGIDAIHGVTFTLNSTLLPQNIAMGATRNTELSRLAGEITAKETRASGIRWNFAPVLDVGRMPLWPRFGETYGEDTYLCAEMGVASIKGMEGDGNLNRIDRVASCMKHYMGYSWPASGKDRTPAYIPERQLREIFLPTFMAAVKAGSHTIMINSGEINGIPVHGDKYLLTDILRGELGFTGVAVSDWEDIIRLYTKHKIAPTMKDAVMIAVNAGIDMSMVPHKDYIENFYQPLLELVKEGKVSEARINEAVGRILRLKFETGLFENPYPEKEAIKNFGLPEYKTAALEAARECITLLKNDGSVLPLPKTGKKILVTGPGAKSITSLNGSWSYTWQGNMPKYYPDTTAHTFNAIKAKVGAANVVYMRGTKFENRDYDIKETVEAAKNVDYVILCLGEDAYAESPGVIDNLDLPEVQIRLAKALYETGKPVIIVLTEGRPRIIREIVDGAKGILMAYIPGSQGHNAIADVLFGDYNPNGKLPFSYPKFSGDLLTYDHKYSEKVTELQPGRMGEQGYKPQWPFGFGLSYTKYEYSNLKLSSKTLSSGGTIKVSVDVKNAGSRAGKEAVELYTRDHFASITPPQQRLRKFKKVTINPGQVVTVEFELSKSDLAFVGVDSKTWVTEAGDFDVMVGGLKDTFAYQE
ncbi:MAG: glycoside hydrolase family 3 C-terminal domain-containing protein [Cytophagaceae bacterium]|nr:glycoside hydrolase family 3 C-terminal domain-containing protein [Cytophagaceae bacterium]